MPLWFVEAPFLGALRLPNGELILNPGQDLLGFHRNHSLLRLVGLLGLVVSLTFILMLLSNDFVKELLFATLFGSPKQDHE